MAQFGNLARWLFNREMAQFNSREGWLFSSEMAQFGSREGWHSLIMERDGTV